MSEVWSPTFLWREIIVNRCYTNVKKGLFFKKSRKSLEKLAREWSGMDRYRTELSEWNK